MQRVLTLLGRILAAVGLVLAAGGLVFVYFALPVPAAVLGSVGGIFALCGACLVFFVRGAERRRARLLAEGERIDARITAVDYDYRCQINGRCPLVIRCQAVNPADGRVYVFASEGLWFDPAPFLGGIDTVPVYVEPGAWKHYAVDLAGILPEAGN